MIWTLDDSAHAETLQRSVQKRKPAGWTKRAGNQTQWSSFFNSNWLVVEPPLWKIWKSMGRIIPYIMENKKKQTTNQLRLGWQMLLASPQECGSHRGRRLSLSLLPKPAGWPGTSNDSSYLNSLKVYRSFTINPLQSDVFLLFFRDFQTFSDCWLSHPFQNSEICGQKSQFSMIENTLLIFIQYIYIYIIPYSAS